MKRKTINWQTMLLLGRYHWRFLMASCAVGLCLGGILNMTVLHALYSADAKLMIKGGRIPSYVVPTGNETEMQSLTNTGNPLLTQIEVMNSVQLAQRVLQNVKETTAPKQYWAYQQHYTSFFEPHKLAKKLKLKNPANTDIITMELTTPDRHFSTRMLNAYIASYKEFLREINHETMLQRGALIEQRIADTAEKLKEVRHQLMQYRQAHQTVSLGNEAESGIQQMADLETQKITLDSEVSARRGNIARLQKLLGMSSQRPFAHRLWGMIQPSWKFSAL